MVLTNSNTFTGGTTVTAGTLQLGDGVTTDGYVGGNITDNAVLVFADPLPQTYSGMISGSGSLVKSAAGLLVLSGTDTYTGGTFVTAGKLMLASSRRPGGRDELDHRRRQKIDLRCCVRCGRAAEFGRRCPGARTGHSRAIGPSTRWLRELAYGEGGKGFEISDLRLVLSPEY